MARGIASPTPKDLSITPRDRRFGRAQAESDRQARWWMGGDPVGTAFYNALSVTFPRGEAFFVDSVRAFRDDAPEPLQKEINAFIKQEVLHSREHVAFNRRVVDAGYHVTALEADVIRSLDEIKDRPKILNLAATMALEHFTAILAHQLLANPRHLNKADAESRVLWRWHAIEEIEHKGVAYDTWLFATRDWSRFKRWKVKSLLMLLVTKRFFHHRTVGILELLRQDGLTGPRVWAHMAWFAFGNPGMVRKILGAWIGYFLPGFHPWNHDDRALIALASSDYADAVMPEAVAA
ncbi:metal-dependent hydrolase [Sphingobium algorifonticola]|uniref:Metal-dependent hydrolase n=2 Tax=Sphingobium algorifonticola TaxID=2008318 RepID=A0A437JAA8_9SPHN|nr:metal-dependent hydrolase [Sphingobium algorifonticola]RVT42449.1 metal-dependent hydrolase [Sphingobium algorifonticola]